MKLKNTELRAAAKAARVPLWAIADVFGWSESSMTRKMRTELSAEEKEKFLAAVQELSEQKMK